MVIKYKIRDSDWLTFPLIIVNFNHFLYNRPQSIRTLANLFYNKKNLIITGRPSSSPVMTSIFSTGHSANFDDFEIYSYCSDSCKLTIHESFVNHEFTCKCRSNRNKFMTKALYHIFAQTPS